jgi:hypothetical protein
MAAGAPRWRRPARRRQQPAAGEPRRRAKAALRPKNKGSGVASRSEISQPRFLRSSIVDLLVPERRVGPASVSSAAMGGTPRIDRAPFLPSALTIQGYPPIIHESRYRGYAVERTTF